MRVILVLFLTSWLCGSHAQWVDPHSMDSNAKSKIPNTSQTSSNHNSNDCLERNHCRSDIHLKRIVRLILSNAYLSHEDMGFHQGYLNIKLSDKEHQFLLDFSRSKRVEDQTYTEISAIFEDALQKPIFDRYKDVMSSTHDYLYFFIFNPTSGALAGASLSLLVIYKLIKAHFTWISIIKLFLLFTYVADFVITYLHILHDEEINNMVLIKQLGTVPPECDPGKLSWLEYAKLQFTSAVFENPCKTYYKATFQDFKYFIAPSLVFSRQFKTLVLEPFGDIGEAFGKFGRGMFTSLPWGLNVVLFPILLIAACVFIFMIFLFIAKPHFKLSLFHLITIELGKVQPAQRDRPRIRTSSSRPAVSDRTSGGKTIQVGLAQPEREFIEDVSNNSSRDDSPAIFGANEESPDSHTKGDGANEDSVQDVGSGTEDCH